MKINREVKSMVYDAKRKHEVLDSGKCLNYNYYIMNLGTHPTAYIEIPKEHKLYSKHYGNIDIDVHGGLTYSESYLWIDNETELKDSWFIGWDYAHCGDYLGYEEMYPIEMQIEQKKWTTEEIQEEVIDVWIYVKF